MTTVPFHAGLLLLAALSQVMAVEFPNAPVEDLSDKRARQCLNGLWQFAPAKDKAPPADGWGTIQVPGGWFLQPSWTGMHIMVGGIVTPPAEAVDPKLSRGWYRRSVAIPASWKGRTVELDIDRVSTDAEVWLNGQRCGEVHWSSGTVDLTPAMRVGQDNQLVVLVAAVKSEEQRRVMMGPDAGQQWMVDAPLEAKGIIGDVFLTSRPSGAHVDGVFIQPSVRQASIVIDADVAGLAAAGEVSFTARMLSLDGREEKRFAATRPVVAGAQTVRLEWAWPDPRLWNVGKGELYRLVLEARGAGLDDAYSQEFGFRECWLDGRRLMLNGTELRLRPILASEWRISHPAQIDRIIRSMQDAGWNFAELWPWDMLQRGTVHWRGLWHDAADRAGMPMSGSLPPFTDLVSNMGGILEFPSERIAAYKAAVKDQWLKWRNHPSILVWTMSGNSFGHQQDQNPWLIGRRGFAISDIHAEEIRRAEMFMNYVRSFDRMHPIMNHQASWASDMYTLNCYLNWMPLQEREEYLSAWAKDGDMPFMVVEGGTPFECSFFRNRRGPEEAYRSEPLLSEFAAAYLGRSAYAMESPDYRARIAKGLAKEQPADALDNYSVNPRGQIYDRSNEGVRKEAAFQAIQKLFITNTNRSWRTIGGALMLPWAVSDFWPYGNGKIDLPPTVRGFNRGTIEVRDWEPYSTDRSPPGGKALTATSQPTLAWICAPPSDSDNAAFTDKTHHYRAGTTVAKAAAILNDTTAVQEWTMTVSATVGDRVVLAATETTGKIAPSQTQFQPIAISLPADLGAAAEGRIRLDLRLAGKVHHDEFPFRVFPAPVAGGRALAIDPLGLTTAMMKTQGVEVAAWTPGQKPDGRPLLIGRGYLDDHDRLPAEVDAFVAAGGTAVLFAQRPERLHDAFGFRIAQPMPRRVFPVDAKHPLLAGLDDEALRDWAGTSTLRDDRTGREIPYRRYPAHVWRWGNRHAVSAVAIEKPHQGGWRPLLECEFDLAYTTLMELDRGAGRLVLCTMDLEDHAKLDPAAGLLATNLVNYGSKPPVRPLAGPTVYCGGDAGAAFLASVGLVCSRANQVPADAGLVVVGADAEPDLTAHLARGGRAVYLGRREHLPFGLGVVEKPTAGTLALPAWPELAGLSPSDTRFRTNAAWPLLTKAEGCEVAEGGLFARRTGGSGVAMAVQLDPSWLEADVKTYNRYTRWRHTRTLCQVLANLGGRFTGDERMFVPHREEIGIAGDWMAKITSYAPQPVLTWKINCETRLDGDPVEAKGEAMSRIDADLTGWSRVTLPGGFAQLVPEGKPHNGVGVFRRVVVIPEEWAGKPLDVNFGLCMTDLSKVTWDGIPIQRPKALNWDLPQDLYKVPAELAKPGQHVLGLVLLNNWMPSSVGFNADDMRILPQPAGWTSIGWYHSDYRRDRVYGDDPYRYIRW